MVARALRAGVIGHIGKMRYGGVRPAGARPDSGCSSRRTEPRARWRYPYIQAGAVRGPIGWGSLVASSRTNLGRKATSAQRVRADLPVENSALPAGVSALALLDPAPGLVLIAKQQSVLVARAKPGLQVPTRLVRRPHVDQDCQ